jgi:hypothetical protein
MRRYALGRFTHYGIRAMCVIVAAMNVDAACCVSRPALSRQDLSQPGTSPSGMPRSGTPRLARRLREQTTLFPTTNGFLSRAASGSCSLSENGSPTAAELPAGDNRGRAPCARP